MPARRAGLPDATRTIPRSPRVGEGANGSLGEVDWAENVPELNHGSLPVRRREPPLSKSCTGRAIRDE
jgi:hypothetical protein